MNFNAAVVFAAIATHFTKKGKQMCIFVQVLKQSLLIVYDTIFTPPPPSISINAITENAVFN